MPELPEVETVKNLLNKIVAGHSIKSIDVLRKQNIEGDSTTFVNALIGQKYLSVSRKGKFLLFHLTNNVVVLSHLRMEGKYYEYDEGEPNSKYARVVFHLDNNKKLIYDDSRTFGIMKLLDEDNYLLDKGLAKLGPEPFDVTDVSPIYKKAQKIKLPIKTALLSQELITGLGNIYVDETLYKAKIHPHTPTYLISKKQWEEIIKDASYVMKKAIEMGGSTIKSYHPGKDIDGNFQNELKIYGKAGETCPDCGHTFRFITTNGRGTTFCPVCQTKLGTPINVALTGKIASGKSSVLNTFKDNGCYTISTDEIVKELYQQKDMAKQIEKLFNLSFIDNKVDKDVLRQHLIDNPKDKKKLERYIHPLVIKETERLLQSNKDSIRVVEVPLLFESKMDRMFDTIIVVDSKDNNRLKHQKSRDGGNAPALEKINSSSIIDERIQEAEFIINNNGSLENLNIETQKIINKLKSRLG